MFSLSKIALIVLVVAVVWYGFKALGRFQGRGDGKAARAARDGRAEGRLATEDLVKCRTCGAYVAPDSPCGRGNCPQAG